MNGTALITVQCWCNAAGNAGVAKISTCKLGSLVLGALLGGTWQAAKLLGVGFRILELRSTKIPCPAIVM